MDYEARVRELFPHANALARAVGSGEPKNNDSPGARWLLHLRDSFAENIEEILAARYPSDEIGYDALEVNTYTQWRIFADLELWSFDSELLATTIAEFPAASYRTESAPAIKYADLRDVAETLMAEIAGNLGQQILQALQQEQADTQ